jgi:aminopeptidase
VQGRPARLETSIAAVRRVLEGGRTLRITHPNGTDLTLDITGRPLLQNDGVVPPEGAPERFTWLPAGEVYLAPVAGSGSGRVVLERMLHRGRELRDVTFTFENGRLTTMESPSDISELRAQYDNAPPGREVLGAVDFGVNPGITSQRVLAWVTSGVVTVMLGDNVWAGGENNVPFGLPLHMPGTTVRVDDRILIEDGVLRAQ